jgi:uncharacterized protein YdbL (DUF1318 family)
VQQFRSLATVVNECDAERALRYRNLALQTRMTADALRDEDARDRLLQRAAEFERLAEIYEPKIPPSP